MNHIDQAGELRVWHTGSSTAPLTVLLRISGDAEVGIDYKALPQSVTIPAHETFASIAVTTLPTSRDNRQVIISPANGLIGCPSRALVVIQR